MTLHRAHRSLTHLCRTLGLGLVALLAACTTPLGSTPANQLPSAEKPANTEISGAPNVIVEGRSSKAIIEDIIRTRSAKGMQIRSRSNQRIEFGLKMANTSVPTEARMQYVLTPVTQGWRVSARVFQITNPGSAKEKTQEITGAVADKLNEELANYATNAKK